jgi:hypothetical protein
LVGGLVVFSVLVPLVFFLDFDGLEDDDAAVDGDADGAMDGLEVGDFDGLEDGVFDGGADGATDGVEVGASVGGKVGVHVPTAQKGPSDEVGVALKVHPEDAKMSVFVMDGIVSFHGHKF